jgi:hypothetical protein
MQTLIYPTYFRIFRRRPDGWSVVKPSIFYNPYDSHYDLEADWKKYGVNKQKLVVELFRQYGGKLGYYLANLRDKKYYYCGLTDKDIQETLYSLGIGRKENA